MPYSTPRIWLLLRAPVGGQRNPPSDHKDKIVDFCHLALLQIRCKPLPLIWERSRLGLAGSRPSYSVFPMSGMTIRSIRLHRHWLGSRKENRAMSRQLVRLSFVFTTHIERRSRIIATFPGNRLGFGGLT